MIRTIFQTTILLATLTSAARADAVLLTFTGPASGAPGSTVTLVASVDNQSGADTTLDGLSFVLEAPFTDYDTTAFFANWPLSLDASGPGSQFGPAAMFDLTIPLATAPGLYDGNLVDLYGGGGSLLLTTQSFAINVISPAPEPATSFFAVLGLGALVLIRKETSVR